MPLMVQAVENDLKVAAKARKEVENQAQKMLAQGMKTQVHTNCTSKLASIIRSVSHCCKATLRKLDLWVTFSLA